MQAFVHTHQIEVRGYEVGPDGYVHVQQLCNYLQDAADANAHALGVGFGMLLERNRAWVLARLRIVISRLPRFGDRLTVLTWASGSNKLYAFRQFRVLAAGDLLASAASAWPMLDVEKRVAIRMPEEVRAIQPPLDAPEELALEPDKVQDLAIPTSEILFTVRYADLDYNGHVNNAALCQWLLEAALPLAPAPWRLCEMRIRYRAELTMGEGARSLCAPPPDSEHSSGRMILLHRLCKESDHSELTSAISYWQRG